MSKTPIKADINFEQELWKAANELRGAVAKNQYKDYILPLIFLKHMSERYEIRKEELLHLVQDKTSGYRRAVCGMEGIKLLIRIRFPAGLQFKLKYRVLQNG